jgi:hypothetical protein
MRSKISAEQLEKSGVNVATTHQRRGEDDTIERPRLKTTNTKRLCAIHMNLYPLAAAASRGLPLSPFADQGTK